VTKQSSESILVWNGLVAHGVPPRTDEGSRPVATGTPPGRPGRPELPRPPMRKQRNAAEQTNGEQSASEPPS
jgi:hypothetical protein